MTLVPRLVEEGASDKNEGQGLIDLYRDQLENIRFWGLPKLQPGSFELTGNDQFKAVTANGMKLDGKILNARDNRPLTLSYKMPDGSEVSLNYSYADNQPLPNYFDLRTVRNGQPVGVPRTNWIDEVTYGVDKTIPDGYAPSGFFTNYNRFTHIAIWSNGVEYVLGPKGEKMINHPTMPPSVYALGGEGSRKSARWVMASIVCISAVGGWLIVRRTKSE